MTERKRGRVRKRERERMLLDCEYTTKTYEDESRGVARKVSVRGEVSFSTAGTLTGGGIA